MMVVFEHGDNVMSLLKVARLLSHKMQAAGWRRRRGRGELLRWGGCGSALLLESSAKAAQ
jgi:hypothetical protein